MKFIIPNIDTIYVQFTDTQGRIIKASISDIINNGVPWDIEADEAMEIWSMDVVDEDGKPLDFRPEKT